MTENNEEGIKYIIVSKDEELLELDEDSIPFLNYQRVIAYKMKGIQCFIPIENVKYWYFVKEEK